MYACLGRQMYPIQLLSVEYKDRHQAVAVGSFAMFGVCVLCCRIPCLLFLLLQAALGIEPSHRNGKSLRDSNHRNTGAR